MLALAPGGTRAYTANIGSGTVTAIGPWFAGDQHLTLTSGRTPTTGRGYRERLLARVRR